MTTKQFSVGDETFTLDKSKPHATFVCPCGGVATVGETTEKGEAVVLHTMPMCAEFERMEPADYMKWSRTNGARSLS